MVYDIDSLGVLLMTNCGLYTRKLVSWVCIQGSQCLVFFLGLSGAFLFVVACSVCRPSTKAKHFGKSGGFWNISLSLFMNPLHTGWNKVPPFAFLMAISLAISSFAAFSLTCVACCVDAKKCSTSAK